LLLQEQQQEMQAHQQLTPQQLEIQQALQSGKVLTPEQQIALERDRMQVQGHYLRQQQRSIQAASAFPEELGQPAAKRARSRWDPEDSTAPPQAAPPAAAGGGLYDIDPRDLAAAQAQATMELQAQLAIYHPELMSDQGLNQPSSASSGPTLAQPKQRVRIRQYVRDDWRWSKGTENLSYFEEVTLAPSLLALARKVIGPGSRYPARIADDTDCITEVTAWGTLLVRPRGTGANIALAKRMLYEVLHPSGERLREDALITPDEMAEAAIRDQSTISAGGGDEAQGGKLVQGVKRTFGAELRHVGLGAEQAAMAENKAGELPKTDTRLIELEGSHVQLLWKHIDDLRMASGALCLLSGTTLKIMGKERATKKAEQLAKNLIATGEWTILEDSFVVSEETLAILRASEGPAEQILIKIPDGPLTKKIELHRKAMERASLAQALKLTSKAVAGKRTLMVDGSKAAHERVKLMVKELSERGESPMLTKAINALKKSEENNAASQTASTAGVAPPGPTIKVDPKSEVVIKEEVGPGIIAAKAMLHPVKAEVKEEIIDDGREDDEDEVIEVAMPVEPAPLRPKGLGPGPAMRHLPAPKIKPEVVKIEEGEEAPKNLFEGLPNPDTVGSASIYEPEGSFPPKPPASFTFGDPDSSAEAAVAAALASWESSGGSSASASAPAAPQVSDGITE